MVGEIIVPQKSKKEKQKREKFVEKIFYFLLVSDRVFSLDIEGAVCYNKKVKYVKGRAYA